MSQQITVIGAGIVGICTAIELQRRGLTVTLLDRSAPASETSFGNAGVISRGSVFPSAAPGVHKKLPQILTNRSREARLHYRYLAQMSPWARLLFKNARPETFEKNIAALNGLVGLCLQKHKELMGQCNGLDLLRESGWIKLFRTPESFEGSASEQHYLETCGIDFERLAAADIQSLESSLKAIFTGGLWIKNTASVSSPGRVCELYTQLFTDRGGSIVQDELQALEFSDGSWKIECSQHQRQADSVVIALGAWSKVLLERLGYTVPMVVERGYHMHYQLSDIARLSRPVYDVDGGYVMSPMQRGLRVTTGVEWGSAESAPTPLQLKQVEPYVKQAIAIGEPVDKEPWLGRRPCMPDSLPVISAAHKHQNLWLAFGHGHMGFSMGPITGQLIADLMTGQTPALPMDAFKLQRFGS